MEWFEALILGLIQGLTEFLPVSSSGHLQIFKEILGVEISSDLTFEVIVHAATVCSTIVVLHKEVGSLLKGFFRFKRSDDMIYVLKLMFSMIPVMIVGLCFKDDVEEIFGEGLAITGVCLLVTACLLAFASFAKKRVKTTLSFRDAFIIGVAQAIAVLPGLSRSGSTIATGILLGNNKEQVAKFSFLMVLIPILGMALLDVVTFIVSDSANDSTTPVVSLIAGFLAAFLAGMVACRWMVRLVAKGKMIWFAAYCFAMGIVVCCW